MIHIVYAGNTSTVELRDLRTAVDGQMVDNATVRMTLYTLAGQPVAGQTWPITLGQVPGFPGRYTGSFSHLTMIQAGVTYEAVITVVLPNGSEAKWRETVQVRERGQQPQYYAR